MMCLLKKEIQCSVVEVQVNVLDGRPLVAALPIDDDDEQRSQAWMDGCHDHPMWAPQFESSRSLSPGHSTR